MSRRLCFRTFTILGAALLLSLSLAQGVLKVAVPFAITTLDPQGINGLDIGTTTAANHIFDTLVVRDSDTFEPSVAESWSNPDARTWVFKLREDVLFHDGSPLTSEDVKTSMDRYVELDGPAAALFSPITVTTNGDYEVVMTTEEPMGTLLVNLTRMFIGSSEDIATEDFGTAPVGTGPFTIEDFEVDNRVVLSANEDYWAGAPSLDGLELLRIPEVSSRLTALRTGEIDLTWLIPADQLRQLQEEQNIEIASVPSYGSYVIWFNSSQEPFTDARVRRAVWHAIDFEAAIENLYEGIGVAADAPITPQVFGYAPQRPYEYDPELARSLLAEAGFPDGFETSMMWKNEEYSDLSYTIISDLAEVGITVAPQQKEHAIWIQDLVNLNFSMNNMIQSAATGDADILLGRLYQCAAERTGYCNPQLDELLLAARAELDQDKRLDLYAQASEIVWEEAVGMFPIDMLENYAHRQRVENFQPAPSSAPDFTSVTLGD
ncbi:MAG: ABC transporter substrate-binding protein [Trueperaceae bacterium]